MSCTRVLSPLITFLVSRSNESAAASTETVGNSNAAFTSSITDVISVDVTGTASSPSLADFCNVN